MSITTLDLMNARVDLADVLSWRVAQTPRFISLFNPPRSNGNAAPRVATNTEHFWLEGVDAPKTKAFTSYSYDAATQTGAFAVASSVGWQVGDLCHILGDSRAMRIASVGPAQISLAHVPESNGSIDLATYSATSGGTIVFDSRPIQEGSSAGEDFFMQSDAASNFTQIFRGDVELTGTAAAIRQAGMENDVSTQLQRAVDAIIRRMNAALVFGVKTRRTAATPGALGGLYYFGRQEDGLGRPQSGAPALTMNKLNQAAQDVLDAGCTPDVIVCGTGQAQVISTFMASQVQVGEGSRRAGRFVDTFVTSAGGATLRVVVEPSIPDGDVWVCDSRGFALLPLATRALRTEPATTPGVDGSKAIVIGEYTAEFKNAKQALCLISGLQPSALAFA